LGYNSSPSFSGLLSRCFHGIFSCPPFALIRHSINLTTYTIHTSIDHSIPKANSYKGEASDGGKYF
jgi:hypothetical protein